LLTVAPRTQGTNVERSGIERIHQRHIIQPGIVGQSNHDTTWVVHPFLFDDLGVEVALDWEHTQLAWIEPIELGAYDTVIGLRRTLEAALGALIFGE